MAVVPDAVGLYRRFHAKDPDALIALPPSVRFPERLGDVGRALHILYQSAKWSRSGQLEKYLHSYESDVRVGEPWRPGLRRIGHPRWPNEVVELGECLGLDIEAAGGVLTARLARPTKLLATPDGRALALLTAKDGIVAVVFGGEQRVTEKGIEG